MTKKPTVNQRNAHAHLAVAVIDTGAGRRFGAALGTERRPTDGVIESVVSEAFDLPRKLGRPGP